MTSRRIRGDEKGFSLAELSLVIAIMGLAASFSWPALQQFTRNLSIRAAAYTLADELHGAREKAVVSGERQLLLVRRSPFLLAESGSPEFHPDGSSSSFEARFGTAAKEIVVVRVKPTGEIDVQDL